MNRTPRLSKSGIEYLDYVWSFYSGCWNWKNGVCPVGENCWAKGITVRFPAHYPNGFEPTYYPEAFLSPLHLKKPSIIGCAFMGDLFGDWVDPYMFIQGISTEGIPSCGEPEDLRGAILATIECCPQHTFLFLTKCPWNLSKWSPFPENCWVGVTATDPDMAWKAADTLRQIEAKVKYISFEPLLASIQEGLSWPATGRILSAVNWLIIGAQTRPTVFPKIEWVEEIVEAADKAGVKVFLKDNLEPLLPGRMPFCKRQGEFRLLGLRQEIVSG